MRPTLSTRQDYVIEQLYASFGWSVLTIAHALTLGRRVVENALRRREVHVGRRSKKPFLDKPVIPVSTAILWFERAASEELAGLEPPTRVEDGVAVYRRRRCPSCARLTTYVSCCPGCGELLDFGQPVAPSDLDIAELRKLEELR